MPNLATYVAISLATSLATLGMWRSEVRHRARVSRSWRSSGGVRAEFVADIVAVLTKAAKVSQAERLP